MKAPIFSAILSALASARVHSVNSSGCLDILSDVRGSEMAICLCLEDVERLQTGAQDVQIDYAYCDSGEVWPLATPPGEDYKANAGEAWLALPPALIAEILAWRAKYPADYLASRSDFDLKPYPLNP